MLALAARAAKAWGIMAERARKDRRSSGVMRILLLERDGKCPRNFCGSLQEASRAVGSQETGILRLRSAFASTRSYDGVFHPRFSTGKDWGGQFCIPQRRDKVASLPLH